MNNNQENVRDRQIKQFIQNLSRLDAGELARLKRNVGNTLAESRQVRMIFYQKILPYGVSSPWIEDRYFLLATLYPLDKAQRQKVKQFGLENQESIEEVEQTMSTTLGASFRQALTEQNKAGLDKRFARLLDADIQQFPFQLRQAITRLTNAWVPIDWEQLTKDVLNWESSSRYVQRNWARDYISYTLENQEKGED